jgi:hypothetical protein
LDILDRLLLLASNMGRGASGKSLALPALLIDNCDAPLRSFAGDTQKYEEAAGILKGCYEVIDSHSKNISFLFATGVAKLEDSPLSLAFKKVVDITKKPGFGAIAGFTEDDIRKLFYNDMYYYAKLKNVAFKRMLDDMKQRCACFSFDGLIHVYNPTSILGYLLAQRPKIESD